MRAVLNGGPAHGRDVYVNPGTTTYLVGIPRPIEIIYPFDQPDVSSMPDYDVARYVFMGIGVVGLNGVCSALIFDYQGTFLCMTTIMQFSTEGLSPTRTVPPETLLLIDVSSISSGLRRKRP